jgi:hypothetical protein
MNDIFKAMNSKKIILEGKYYLEPDSDHGLVLTFEEERIREKKDGTEEKYLFQDRWFFPRTSQTLSKYLSLVVQESNTIEELKETVERVENLILTIKEKW